MEAELFTFFSPCLARSPCSLPRSCSTIATLVWRALRARSRSWKPWSSFPFSAVFESKSCFSLGRIKRVQNKFNIFKRRCSTSTTTGLVIISYSLDVPRLIWFLNDLYRGDPKKHSVRIISFLYLLTSSWPALICSLSL